VKSLADQVLKKYSRLDVLVNNAGVFEEFDILSLSYGEWQRSWEKTIKTNLTGAANLSFLIAKEMAVKGGPRTHRTLCWRRNCQLNRSFRKAIQSRNNG